MSDKKTCLIIQSGAMGDIFVVAPIAEQYYKRGYLVYWPVRKAYFNFVSNYLPYVSALLVTDEKFPALNPDWLRSDTMHLKSIAERGHYDLVLDLADRGATPNELPGETFEETKYRIAQVLFSVKNHMSWVRNYERETELKHQIQSLYRIDIDKDSYVVAHLQSSHGDKAEMPAHEKRQVIEIMHLMDYEIADWFPIIKNAEAVYAVESSVHQFIDGAMYALLYEELDILLPKKKFYLLSRSSLQPGQSYTKSINWDKSYMK